MPPKELPELLIFVVRYDALNLIEYIIWLSNMSEFVFAQLRVSFSRQARVQCIRVQFVIELSAANEVIRTTSIYKFLGTSKSRSVQYK